MPAAPPRSADRTLLDRDGRTDDANGRRLATAYGDKLRWCQQWKQWLVWNGKCWPTDNELRAEAFAKDVARRIWNDVFDLQGETDNPHELRRLSPSSLLTRYTHFEEQQRRAAVERMAVPTLRLA